MTLQQARVRFRRKVAKLGSLEAAAAVLGISYSYISKISSGHRNPSGRVASLIQSAGWGIPAAAWWNDEHTGNTRKRTAA